MAEVNENQGGEVNDGDLKENRIDEDGEEKKKRKYKTTPKGRRDLSRAEDMNVCLKYCSARVYHQGGRCPNICHSALGPKWSHVQYLGFWDTANLPSTAVHQARHSDHY